MEHNLGDSVTPSAISTHCQAKKTLWEVLWCSGHLSQNSSRGAVKGHFMGAYFSLWIFLPVSGQLFCWVLKWTSTLLLVLRCIYLSKEAALAVSSHYIFCCTCCKLVLSSTVKLFLCGNERFTKKWQKIWYRYHSDLFPVQKVNLLARWLTDCCLWANFD